MFSAFWLRNVLRATTAMHFLNVPTVQSASNPQNFHHFDFEMCFAPQPRALWVNISTVQSALNPHFFSILASKSALHHKCSDNEVFWRVLIIFTSECASHGSSVHFSTLNFQKCYEAEVFWVLRATATCNVWSLIQPDGSARVALASLLVHRHK